MPGVGEKAGVGLGFGDDCMAEWGRETVVMGCGPSLGMGSVGAMAMGNFLEVLNILLSTG